MIIIMIIIIICAFLYPNIMVVTSEAMHVSTVNVSPTTVRLSHAYAHILLVPSCFKLLQLTILCVNG